MDYEELRAFPVHGARPIDLLERLRQAPGIRLVAVREKPDVYRLLAKHGEARLERALASFRYTVTGEDPLGYAVDPVSAPLLDGAYHDKDAWFEASAAGAYPDALFQIAQLFDARRCGDVVLSSSLGSDLLDQGHIGTHGGLERAEMTVPCVLAGPGVRHGVIPRARTIDVQPTFLKFLGFPHFEGEVMNVFL